jgi:Tol biopolymer transport system component
MKRNFYWNNLTGYFFCFFLLAFFSFQSNGYPAPSSYFDTVQKTYIGYYQRAADPGGLIYWANRLDARAGNLNEIIEAFANEPESQALYGTINSSNISTVVDSIYNALFGRDAEHGAGGLDFWVNGFNAGTFTAATIMLNILNAAQNEDLLSVNNKLTAANLFTRTIDPELDGSNFQVTYAGDGDVIAGRNFLAFVTSNLVTVPTQGETTAYIQTNIANPGDPILGQTPPSAPSNVSTTSGNTQAVISWSPVAGATSYNIYWSTTSGVTKTSGTKITGATSPYSHTGLTNGTTYYYIVTAVNSSGESVESAQVSATPTVVTGGVLPSEGIVFVSIRDGWNGIWVMNTDGSNPRRLSSVAKNYFGDNDPSSSPDGSKIVFAREGTGIVVLDNSGEEIVKNYIAGEGPWYTTWSYNGTIYFTRWNNSLPGAKEYIYSVNEDGTGEVQVSPQYNSGSDAQDRYPSISPDGTTLIFSTNREGVGSSIGKMIIGSGSLVHLTDISGLGSATITPAEQPSWSPDGSKIAFAAYPGYPDWTRKEQIYVMNADGSGKVPLTSETGADCSYPSWSPDGSKIVFQKDYPGFSNTTEIWIMNADGSGAIALTDRNVTHYDGQPCFIKKPR